MKIIHAADLHIDSPLRGLSRYEGVPAQALRAATRRAFSKLIDTCIAENAAILVLVGDIYDGEAKDYNTAAFFNAELTRLRAVGTRVVMLLGNHDAASVLTKSLPYPSHARLLRSDEPETVHFEDLGVAIHGQSFATRAVKDDLAAQYPPRITDAFNIGMLHTSLDGREGHAPYAPTQPSILQRLGYDYFALGHVHARETISEAPYIAYPGNLQGRHIKETGAKGALILEVQDSGTRKVERVAHLPCDVLRWDVLRVDVSRAERRDDIVEACVRAANAAADAAEGRPLVARIVLTGATAKHFEFRADYEHLEPELRNALRNAREDLWLEKLQVRTTLPANEKTAGNDSARSELLRLISAGTQDGAAAAAALYGALPAKARRDAQDDASNDEFYRELYEDARALLLSRLGERHED